MLRLLSWDGAKGRRPTPSSGAKGEAGLQSGDPRNLVGWPLWGELGGSSSVHLGGSPPWVGKGPVWGGTPRGGHRPKFWGGGDPPGCCSLEWAGRPSVPWLRWAWGKGGAFSGDREGHFGSDIMVWQWIPPATDWGIIEYGRLPPIPGQSGRGILQGEQRRCLEMLLGKKRPLPPRCKSMNMYNYTHTHTHRVLFPNQGPNQPLARLAVGGSWPAARVAPPARPWEPAAPITGRSACGSRPPPAPCWAGRISPS